VVVELLSPGTEKEDLGQTRQELNEPPTKWQVYEQILRVPYYVVFDRYTDQLLGFEWVDGYYREMSLNQPRVTEESDSTEMRSRSVTFGQ